MIKKEYKYSDITSKIIGCAFEVHNILGNGFQELIYQRALEEEMILRNINFVREADISIYYKDKMIGSRRVDFLVEDVVVVELKAIAQLEEVHFAQAINYIEAFEKEVGLLINFGGKSLEHRRFIKTKK